MLCISAAYAVMRCLSVFLYVCVYVMFVDSVKTNNHIVKIFSPSGSYIILVFPYHMARQYSDGKRGVECRWGRQKSWFWANVWFHFVLWTVPAADTIHLAVTDHGKFITLVAGKRRSLLMAKNNDEVYDRKPQRYTEGNAT